MSPRLLRSTATVGIMTLLSRILGFLRDMVVARYFGAGLATDAFFVANRIPNMLRRLFAEGAFSQAFVPVLTQYKSTKGVEDVRDLVDRVTGTLGAALFLVTLIGVIAAPLLVLAFAPGFSANASQWDLASVMLRITFPYILFISLTALAGAILNTYGRFWVPAFTPVLLNLVIIAAAIWLSPLLDEPITALAWAILVAGLIQLAFQLPFLRALGLLPRPRWGWRHPGVRTILRLMMPALFGSSVAQVNILFDTLIASFLATGSVSWLFYADRLLEFPLGVFGIALGTVILPSLSQRHAEQDQSRFSQTLDWAMRMVVVVGVPATLGLFILSGPILTTLFQYGQFSDHDARMSSLALTAYSFGLLGFLMVKVLAPGFYARQNTRTPVRIGVIAMLSNMVLNLAFVVPMVLSGYEAPHAGVALATAISAFINSGLLWLNLRRENIWRASRGWPKLLFQVAAASLVMVALLIWTRGSTAQWLGWSALTRGLHLAALIGAGITGYFATLLVLGLRPGFFRRH